MLFILLISLHILFVLLYAIAIELKISRHSYIHLLFAAAVPFAGELCLLASEFGRTSASFEPQKLFKYQTAPKENHAEGEMEYSVPVSRETLLRAIEAKPSNLVEILFRGVESDNIETAHISAATVMKLQREHENKISALRDEHLRFEDNMETLREYTAAVGAYYKSGLLRGEAAKELLTLQEKLLQKLFKSLPDDHDGTIMYIDNLWAQGRTDEALALCERARKKHGGFELWSKNDKLLAKSGAEAERAALRNEAEAVLGEWEPDQIRQWYTEERD